MRKIISTEIKVEPAIINDLNQTGRIVKGFLHLVSGKKIRAKGGRVERVDNNGEKRIVLRGDEFSGNTFVSKIKVA